MKILFLVTGFVLTTLSYAQKPGDGVWENYDFVPGHNILAAHNFEDVRVGNFPDRITYMQGDAEVVQLENDADKKIANKVLRTQNEGRFIVPFASTLPDKFTVEFRLSATDARSKVLVYSPAEKAPIKSPSSSIAALISPASTGLSVGKYNEGPKATLKLPDGAFVNKWINVRIAVDGNYMKMYINEKRYANLPQAEFPRKDGLAFYFSVYPYDGGSVYLDDIRIAEGGRTMLYDELQQNGFAITQGILFDLNSDTLRPESTPTLQDLGKMLVAHGDLNIRIEGHTDNTGSAELNQLLSERRANAVRAWLITTYNIPPDQLKAEGFGASRPRGPNDTPESRQMNRRVELHKL